MDKKKKRKKKTDTGKQYCHIEFEQITIDCYNIPEDFGKDEFDEEFTLSITGTNLDNYISILMPPCYETDSTFEIQITSDVAKQMITAMETIIKEQEKNG